jgi:LysM repeat protein|mmetsp:Transcript_8679/g.36368  ORF Transcript_8679/g.36368 Transcript_8679/m.36368 type:complete len:238 (-) Transcript_8679:155-868(-)
MVFTARTSPAALGARRAVVPNKVSARGASVARRFRAPFAPRAAGQAAMRPYTLRKGDTLESIAQKRSMSVDEIKKCNSRKDGDAIKVGDTILLPAGKLSARDNEIIDGIAKINQPRVYPTRKGESIMDIIEPRNIAFEDVKKLNPGVNLGTFNNGEKLKLPPGKYTTREKEMLQGCGILPPETVNPLAILVSPNSLALFGAATLAGVYAMYFAACKRYQEHGIKLWGNEEGAKQGSR